MKKILVLAAVLLSTACSPVNQAVNTTETNVINVSAKQGANLTVKFDFGDFTTKASTNGTAAAVVGDIQSAKLYLTTSNTDPLAAGNIVATSGTLTFTGPSQTYTYGNVPAGTYYAAVELFSDAGGTTNIIEPVAYGGTTGTRGVTVSTNSSTVSASYVVSFSDSATSFALAPALKNATGASLEADVSPTNGNNTPSGVISIN